MRSLLPLLLLFRSTSRISPVPLVVSAIASLLLLAAVIMPTTVCAGDEEKFTDPSWQFEIKQKTLINSHTSYEFGNPDPPYQQPLSRLEFPVNSAWAGFEIKKRLSRFSGGIEFMTTVVDQETGRFKDTDWADNGMPGRLTNYGETDTRLNPSFQVGADIDIQVADLLRLPEHFDFRPVLGFNWQQLSLLSHDGTQLDYDTPDIPPTVLPLPGSVISFEQNWYRYFLGLRFGYQWTSLPYLHHLKLETQADWSYVQGNNLDRHLLRGDRITFENTTGDAWHGSLGVLIGLAQNVELGLAADYLYIQTTGTHTWREPGVDQSWSYGVKSWSEQFGLQVKLGYHF